MTIRIYRPLGVAFCYWQAVWNAVGRAGAGKHKIITFEQRTGLQQFSRAADVGIVIFERLDSLFSDISVGCEVHDRPRSPCSECSMQVPFISDVSLLERTPLYCPRMPPFQVVESDRLIACFRQRLARMATDETSATRHQYGFHLSSSYIF